MCLRRAVGFFVCWAGEKITSSCTNERSRTFLPTGWDRRFFSPSAKRALRHSKDAMLGVNLNIQNAMTNNRPPLIPPSGLAHSQGINCSRVHRPAGSVDFIALSNRSSLRTRSSMKISWHSVLLLPLVLLPLVVTDGENRTVAHGRFLPPKLGGGRKGATVGF